MRLAKMESTVLRKHPPTEERLPHNSMAGHGGLRNRRGCTQQTGSVYDSWVRLYSSHANDVLRCYTSTLKKSLAEESLLRRTATPKIVLEADRWQ